MWKKLIGTNASKARIDLTKKKEGYERVQELLDDGLLNMYYS